jgi:hypothetical protein
MNSMTVLWIDEIYGFGRTWLFIRILIDEIVCPMRIPNIVCIVSRPFFSGIMEFNLNGGTLRVSFQ